MIQQPELGKKIAELRKEKGLTQEELVNKCNLNVRTLQRIESGEATPRFITLRLIFEALEYPFDKTEDKEPFKNKLDQFHFWFIDLFNLKTHTMKKLSILSTPFILLLIFLLANSYDVNAQRRIQKKMIGTWAICNPDSTVATTLSNMDDCLRYKVISKESFMVFHFGKNNKRIYGTFWGTYTLNKGVYTEYVNYSNYNDVRGVVNAFKVKINDDLMFVEGVNNDFIEIWRKIKD